MADTLEIYSFVYRNKSGKASGPEFAKGINTKNAELKQRPTSI
jgi:hypothetical protein